MFGIGKSEEEKVEAKTEKVRQKWIKTLPAELFEGLDPSHKVLGQGGQWGRNIVLGKLKQGMKPGEVVGDVHGFWSPNPVDGDYLKVNMRSGNRGVFKLTGIGKGWTANKDKHPFGPKDYFEAKIIWLGYEQDMGVFDRTTIKS